MARYLSRESGGQRVEKPGASEHAWEQAGIAAAALLGSVWAALPVLLAAPPSPEDRFLIVALLFAAKGIGALALAASRPSANVFIAMLTGVSAVTAAGAATPAGFALACFALAYGWAVAAVARLARQMAADTRAARRDVMQRDGLIGKTAQFLEDVTHEIRAPLTTVLGFAEILNSSSVRDLSESESRAYRALLLDSSRRLSGFVADVCDMVRLDRDRLHLSEHEVDAAELAEIAMKSCAAAAEDADVTILATVFDGVELRCDSFRIRRAIVTLLTRAVQASPPGGTVRLCFGRTMEAGLVIAIIDHGRTLAPAEMAAMFEPAVAERGMAGLALPIARLYAMLHGGGVDFESVQDGGTTARLVLPAGRVSWDAGESPRPARAA